MTANRLLGDAAVDHAEAADLGTVPLEADDDVVPGGIHAWAMSVGLGYGSVCVWLCTTPTISHPFASASRSARRWSSGSTVYTFADSAALRQG